MNKEIIYVNGKCVIEDEERNRRVEDYTDKTEEILVTENIIETLEIDLEDNIDDLERCEKRVKSYKKDIIFNICTFLSMPIVIQLLFRELVGPNSFEIMFPNSMLVPGFIKIFFSSVILFFGSIFVSTSIEDSIRNKRKIEALKSEKKAIEKSLKEENEYLQQLHEVKNNTVVEVEFFSKDVDDLEALRNIRSQIELYYDCGYNKNKYGRYFQNGTLERKLGKYYNERGIELVEEYLEEQGFSRRLTK